jgi:hypothetical protein
MGKDYYFEIDKTNNKLPELLFHFYTLKTEGFISGLFLKTGIFQIYNRYLRNKYYRRICSILNEELDFYPQLLYAMTAQINGSDAYLLSRMLNIPVILAEHVPFPLPGTIISNDIKYAMENCNKIITVSNDKTRQVLMQNINCEPIVVGNMVNEKFLNLNLGEKVKDFLIF